MSEGRQPQGRKAWAVHFGPSANQDIVIEDRVPNASTPDASGFWTVWDHEEEAGDYARIYGGSVVPVQLVEDGTTAQELVRNGTYTECVSISGLAGIAFLLR